MSCAWYKMGAWDSHADACFERPIWLRQCCPFTACCHAGDGPAPPLHRPPDAAQRQRARACCGAWTRCLTAGSSQGSMPYAQLHYPFENQEASSRPTSLRTLSPRVRWILSLRCQQDTAVAVCLQKPSKALGMRRCIHGAASEKHQATCVRYRLGVRVPGTLWKPAGSHRWQS